MVLTTVSSIITSSVTLVTLLMPLALELQVLALIICGTSIDRDASMFGIRVGKTFKNVSMSPTITLWYDQLSGVDDDDHAGGDWGQFDTMYDTGHKFYGFQDFYLNRTGGGTG